MTSPGTRTARHWISTVVAVCAIAAAAWAYLGLHRPIVALVCAAVGAFAPALVSGILGRGEDSEAGARES